LSDETVGYGYDGLGRLASATAPGWSQTFTFDGFGNIAQKQGAGTAQYIGTGDYRPSLNSLKNQVGSYDAAGNAAGFTYDYDNRLTMHVDERYSYDASNHRVWKQKTWPAQAPQEITFWAGSQRMGVYKYVLGDEGWSMQVIGEWGTIGGRAMRPMDRLGSDVSDGRKYLPYGEELNPGPGGTYRFATYWRDEGSELDYADQRYYQRTMGRFLTADPYMASGGAAEPGSWNRYAYVGGDPVNRVDPSGLDWWDASTNTLYGDLDDQLLYAMLMGGYQLYYQAAAQSAAGQTYQTTGVPLADVAQYKLSLVPNSWSKEGPKFGSVVSMIKSVMSRLDPDCERFLSANGPANDYVSTLLSADLVAVADFDVNKAAFTNITGSNLPDGYAAIVFNNNSAFFNSKYTVNQGKLRGGTDKARAFIVLHELAHGTYANDFKPDLNISEAGTHNDKLIEKNCSKTLGSFK
jgi:RHS repeat-associated protein